MDWQMHQQYGGGGAIPNGAYPMPHPQQQQQQQQQQYHQQPGSPPIQYTPGPQYHQQQPYPHVQQQHSPLMQSHSPIMHHPQGPVPAPHHQYGYYQQQPVHQQPMQHYENRPVIMVPQRSPDYLSQFQDYSHYPMPQQPPRPIPQQRQQQQHRPQPQVAPPVTHARPPSQPDVQVQVQIPVLQPRESDVKARPQKSPVKDDTPPLDYHVLLLALADEYISAARASGPLIALKRHQPDLDQYHKLLATGLGCIEVALRNFRLQPRAEASLRLRYATLMYEETNNDMTTEQALSKGILLCERNRLLDLKYSMQHLLARVLFRSSPKAALKSLDKLLPDLETLQHTVWIYAVRFLRASLSLQVGGNQDHLAAISQFRGIRALAEKNHDVGVFVTSAALESMVHLKLAADDSVEQAQQAIASARSYQLQFSADQLVQIWALLDVVDLACALLSHASAEQVQDKLRTMQAVMDDDSTNAAWNENGTLNVAITHTVDLKLVETTGGIFHTDPQGQTLLIFSWLSKRDLYMLGFYLSSVATLQAKPYSDEKATSYLNEGVKMAKERIGVADLKSSTLSSASQRLSWHMTVRWYMQLQLLFIDCSRSNWPSARQRLETLRAEFDGLELSADEEMARWLRHITALIDQSTGNMSSALATYQSPDLALPGDNASQHTSVHLDICILSALNTLFIIRDPVHSQHSTYHDLLAILEPFCAGHVDKGIQAAYSLLRAIAPRNDSSDTIFVRTKQHLQQALGSAKAVSNGQLLAISLNFMTALLFKNIVGEQAEKSARTGLALAKRARSDLWLSVASGQLAETMENCGKPEEAAKCRDEVERLVQGLPPPLKRLCEQS